MQMHNKPQQSLPTVAGTDKATPIFGMAAPFYAKNQLHFICPCAERYARHVSAHFSFDLD